MTKNVVIDRKSQKVTFGLWPIKEDIETTMTLVQMEDGGCGLIYDAEYSGVKKWHATGGPIKVSGNQTATVNEDPPIRVTISDWSETDQRISARVKITVEFMGNHTLYNQILVGPKPATDHLEKAMASMTDGIKASQKDAKA